MLKGLLAYNNSDYARYMGDFWAMVEEMPDESNMTSSKIILFNH